MLGKIRNVITHPCLIIVVCKMVVVSVVMIDVKSVASSLPLTSFSVSEKN